MATPPSTSRKLMHRGFRSARPAQRPSLNLFTHANFHSIVAKNTYLADGTAIGMGHGIDGFQVFYVRLHSDKGSVLETLLFDNKKYAGTEMFNSLPENKNRICYVAPRVKDDPKNPSVRQKSIADLGTVFPQIDKNTPGVRFTILDGCPAIAISPEDWAVKIGKNEEGHEMISVTLKKSALDSLNRKYESEHVQAVGEEELPTSALKDVEYL